jgi:hypothetical protein
MNLSLKWEGPGSSGEPNQILSVQFTIIKIERPFRYNILLLNLVKFQQLKLKINAS